MTSSSYPKSPPDHLKAVLDDTFRNPGPLMSMCTPRVETMTSPIDPIRNAALEEAAKICDGLRHPDYASENADWIDGTEACASAIRRALSSLPVSAGEPAADAKTRESREDVLEVMRYRMHCQLRDGADVNAMRETFKEIERLLDALKIAAPQPVAWDASHNRSHPQVEKRAREIYDKLLGAEDYPWIDGGNSIIQDKCRDQARSELRTAAPSFEKNSEARK